MLILKDECKKRGFTVGEFITFSTVPAQTLRDWCKTKPDLVTVLLNAYLDLGAFGRLANVESVNARLMLQLSFTNIGSKNE